MRTINCIGDLTAYGIEPLTGESCGLIVRIFCDVTEDGVKVVKKWLGCKVTPAEPWNRVDPPRVGSLMLTPKFLIRLGVFALL